jgi:hypothetical protein
MKAEVIFYAFAFFGLALIAHIIIWRIRRPKPAWLPLIAILLVTPLVLVLARLALEDTAGWPLPSPTLSGWIAAYLLHCAMAGGYFFVYPTAEVGSPTFRMILLLSAAGAEGLSVRELEQALDNRDDLSPRIDDLIKMRFVAENNDHLELTSAGHTFLRPFLLFRRILGLPPGEG